ncbi:hypothetical protein IL54_0400 [Sphingobium sp. ba1]|nr:hypothetical protein IL54_0400 [Sphingobium sp. ba1]
MRIEHGKMPTTATDFDGTMPGGGFK